MLFRMVYVFFHLITKIRTYGCLKSGMSVFWDHPVYAYRVWMYLYVLTWGVGLPVCSCLRNLHQEVMIMLHKLFQDYETFACQVFSDEKIFQGIFGHFMPLVA